MNEKSIKMKDQDKKLIKWYFALIMGAENAKSGLWMHRRKSFQIKAGLGLLLILLYTIFLL